MQDNSYPYYNQSSTPNSPTPLGVEESKPNPAFLSAVVILVVIIAIFGLCFYLVGQKPQDTIYEEPEETVIDEPTEEPSEEYTINGLTELRMSRYWNNRDSISISLPNGTAVSQVAWYNGKEIVVDTKTMTTIGEVEKYPHMIYIIELVDFLRGDSDGVTTQISYVFPSNIEGLLYNGGCTEETINGRKLIIFTGTDEYVPLSSIYPVNVLYEIGEENYLSITSTKAEPSEKNYDIIRDLVRTIKVN